MPVGPSSLTCIRFDLDHRLEYVCPPPALPPVPGAEAPQLSRPLLRRGCKDGQSSLCIN